MSTCPTWKHMLGKATLQPTPTQQSGHSRTVRLYASLLYRLQGTQLSCQALHPLMVHSCCLLYMYP
jgi:hypothetical protein